MPNPNDKENTASFNPDTPGNTDLLGFDLYIDTLAGLIKKQGVKTPFCMGVHGEWGSGKTTFMKMLAAKLAEDGPGPRVAPVWFNPWRYSKEKHLIIPFLKTIEAALLRYTEKNKRLGRKILKPFKEGAVKMWHAATALAYGLEGDLKFGPLGSLTLKGSKMIDREEAKIRERLEKAKILPQKLSSLYYDMEDYLRSVASGGAFRIAVFIDDLDRCMPEKALDLLEAIKLFLDMEGYLFVIGVAKEVVEKGIAHHYRYLKNEGSEASSPLSPEKYLEKMIQLPIDLPPVEPGKIMEYIKFLLKDHNEEYKQHADIIEAGVGKNSRALKRFSNLLLFFDALADNLKKAVGVDKNVDEDKKKLMKKFFIPLSYLKWSLIAHNFPRAYEEIKKDFRMLIKLQDAATGKEKTSERGGEEGGIISNLDHILKKILQKGEKEGLLFPDNEWLIAKFVHLAEAAEIRSSEREAATGYAETYKPGDMVRIPKGIFLHGIKKLEKEIDYDYFMDMFPVTNRQYQEFLQDPKNEGHGVPYSDEDWAKPYNWDKKTRAFPEGMEDHPVVLVSLEDAKAYCRWRSQKEEKEHRLPTEEEWEKAARGTDGRGYPIHGVMSLTRISATPANQKSPRPRRWEGIRAARAHISVRTWRATCGNGLRTACSAAARGSMMRRAVGAPLASAPPPNSRGNGMGFRCARTLKAVTSDK